MGIDSVLYEAMKKNPPDIKTIEQCIEGKYSYQWNLFGYGKLNINQIFTFEGKKTTMLHFAVKQNNIKLVEYLLSKPGIDPSMRIASESNMTALHIAIQMENSVCIEILFEGIKKIVEPRGKLLDFIDSFYTTEDGCSQKIESLLYFAVRKGNKISLPVIINLIEKYGKPETLSEFYGGYVESKSGVNVLGNTALHIAAQNGNIETIKQLLRMGFNVDVINQDGDTPLHIATRNANIEVIHLLLQNRAKMIPNVDKETPDDIAEKLPESNPKKQAVVDCIKQKGFFGLPVTEDDSVNYVRNMVLEQFNKEVKKPGGIQRAVTQMSCVLESHLRYPFAKVAIVGAAGGGKSSLTNAFLGQKVAKTGKMENLTEYPTQYVIGGNIFFVDYPGFETDDYSYSDFEKYFCWTAYDLVIVVIGNKLCATKINKCILSAMNATMCKNVIFVCTHLDSVDDVAKDKEDYCIMINLEFCSL